VVMPDTPLVVATRIAERIRSVMEAEAFPLDEQAACIPVTVSIGLADRGLDANPDALFKRADVPTGPSMPRKPAAATG
jgi:two-component system, cell cycle response regulator